MNKLLIAVGAILAFLAIIVLLSLYYAFALYTLWGWFVVPLGIAKISMAHAYGLSLIPTTILGTRGLYAPEDKRKEAAVAAALVPAIGLLAGWIALSFM